ncbi:hypothetical protein [Rhodoferax sp.]|uniref:hypothetical protein n=1 Tax=Rhodoferax sp. TaxID=50421 RepID=UPI0026050E3D|nr:hypothetical protein [Rhodoferax sp.]MDD5002230.1 hypothetical protein [Thiomonas arsenitoxydans]MDD5479384.1 hypothetical protein [Rhodoferax sp.]
MNPTPTPVTEPAAPTLCQPCAGIQPNWRRTPGHAELVQKNNRKAQGKRGLITITRYACDHCGAVWDYANDKADPHAGWSLVGFVNAA